MFIVQDPLPQTRAKVYEGNDQSQRLDIVRKRFEIGGVGEINEHGGDGKEEEDSEAENTSDRGHDKLRHMSMDEHFSGPNSERGIVRTKLT